MFPLLNVKSSAVILRRLMRAQKCNAVGLWLKITLLLISGDMRMNLRGFLFACPLCVGGSFFSRLFLLNVFSQVLIHTKPQRLTHKRACRCTVSIGPLFAETLLCYWHIYYICLMLNGFSKDIPSNLIKVQVHTSVSSCLSTCNLAISLMVCHITANLLANCSHLGFIFLVQIFLRNPV